MAAAGNGNDMKLFIVPLIALTSGEDTTPRVESDSP